MQIYIDSIPMAAGSRVCREGVVGPVSPLHRSALPRTVFRPWSLSSDLLHVSLLVIFVFYYFLFLLVSTVFVVVAFSIRSKHRLKIMLFIMIFGKVPVVILVSAFLFFYFFNQFIFIVFHSLNNSRKYPSLQF